FWRCIGDILARQGCIAGGTKYSSHSAVPVLRPRGIRGNRLFFLGAIDSSFAIKKRFYPVKKVAWLIKSKLIKKRENEECVLQKGICVIQALSKNFFERK
ncbi:MAG: hypothetical protein PHQ75_08610, partial [Thermoguttaceae bacterium]|nr:hypothetical protein [Thermoguttaceae bacterium]